MNSRGNSELGGAMAIGCLMASASAVVTCVMLFINGSLVMAILSVVSAAGPSWARKPEVLQFLLFSLPVALAVAQWMMIDYVRRRLWPRNPG